MSRGEQATGHRLQSAQATRDVWSQVKALAEKSASASASVCSRGNGQLFSVSVGIYIRPQLILIISRLVSQRASLLCVPLVA